jgi:hypothetical protein
MDVRTRPPQPADASAGNPYRWCEWHQHWSAASVCQHCGCVVPACYWFAHLRYGCTVYEGA